MSFDSVTFDNISDNINIPINIRDSIITISNIFDIIPEKEEEEKKLLYVPLVFWFNKDSTLAIPLIAMHKSLLNQFH